MLDFAGGSHSSVYQRSFVVSYGGCAPPPLMRKKSKKSCRQKRGVGKNTGVLDRKGKKYIIINMPRLL